MTKRKRKVGRPSKRGSFNIKQVEHLAGLGLTEEEIALSLGMAHSTLKTYKKDPEFLATMQRGKLKADNRVIKSLFKRAVGYKYNETHTRNAKIGNSKTKAKVDKVVTKEVSPDVSAQSFWLRNRKPEEWRDKQDIELSGEVTMMPTIKIDGKLAKFKLGSPKDD